MKRRHVLVAASGAFVVLGLACVDLFHGTDFETLCTRSPNDPSCGGESGVLPDVIDASALDAQVPHPDFCAWSSTQARAEALRACAWLGNAYRTGDGVTKDEARATALHLRACELGLAASCTKSE